MGLRVNNNIAALNAYRNLSVTDGQMSKSLEKLSSGFRINRAADDAAGLAISEGLRSQIGGLKVAVRNTQDGISVVQTAEGALTETHSILQRMRDLSVQASNAGGLNADAQGNIQSEIGQLKSELNRIAEHHHVQRQEAARRQLQGELPGRRQRRRDDRRQHRHRDGSAGLGVGGVDVTGTGAYTARCRRRRQGVDTPPPPVPAHRRRPSTSRRAHARSTPDRHVASYDDARRHHRLRRQEPRPGSVDYSTATDAPPGPLAAAEHRCQAAFGLTAGRPVRRVGHRHDLHDAGAVTGYTAAGAPRRRRDAGARRRPPRRSPPPAVRTSAIDLIDTAIKTVSTTAGRPRCDPEPVRPHHQQPQRRGREPDRLGEPHPRRRHGAGDGPVHPEPDPVPGRHRDARAGQPGLAGCPAAAQVIESADQLGPQLHPGEGGGPPASPLTRTPNRPSRRPRRQPP